MIPTIRKSKLHRTKRGNFVRNLGGKKLDLGTDEAAAYQRREWIDLVYIHYCQTFDAEAWLDAYHDIAKQIGKTGRAVVHTTSPEDWDVSGFAPPDYSYLDRMRASGIPIDVAGGGQYVAQGRGSIFRA